MLAGEFPQMDQETSEGIVEVEKSKRREAYKAGHSHILVDRLAKRIRWANKCSSGYTDPERPASRPSVHGDVRFLPARRIVGKRPAKSMEWVGITATRPRLV